MHKKIVRQLAVLMLLAGAASSGADSLQDQVNRIERRVGQITPLTLDVEALKRENQRLRGQIEEQQHRIEGLQRKLQDMYLDLDQRISGAPVAEQTPQSAPAVIREQASVQPPEPYSAADAQAAYDRAHALLNSKQRRYPEAIRAFDQFIMDYPGSDLVDNAMYWKGEAHYVTGDNDGALEVFNTLVASYPDSNKVPGALLKIGYIYQAQGRYEQATDALSRLIRDYPASSAVDMAQQRLDKIARESR